MRLSRAAELFFFWPAAMAIRLGIWLLGLAQTRLGSLTIRPAFRLFCRFALYARPVLARSPKSQHATPTSELAKLIEQEQAIAAIPCSCRAGRPACDHPLHGAHETNVCLTFGLAALLHIGSGLGRRLTPQQARELCQAAAASGLAHHAVYSFGALLEVCNCCAATCAVVRAYESGVSEALRASPYVAARDPDCDGCRDRELRVCETICPYGREPSSKACFGCGLCAEHCPRHAIEMVSREEYES